MQFVRIITHAVCSVRKAALQAARKDPQGLLFMGTVKTGYQLGYRREDKITMFGPLYETQDEMNAYCERVFKCLPKRYVRATPNKPMRPCASPDPSI